MELAATMSRLPYVRRPASLRLRADPGRATSPPLGSAHPLWSIRAAHVASALLDHALRPPRRCLSPATAQKAQTGHVGPAWAFCSAPVLVTCSRALSASLSRLAYVRRQISPATPRKDKPGLARFAFSHPLRSYSPAHDGSALLSPLPSVKITGIII